MMTLDCEIFIDSTNRFIQLQAENNTLSPYAIQTVITQIPTSYTVIQNTIINEFTNPPTSQITYLSIRNNVVNGSAFLNGGSNPWRMNWTNTNFNALFGGSISFVFAPNTSSPSYFEISKTGLYKVEIVYNFALLSVGSINTLFDVEFYDITNSNRLAICGVYFSNTTMATCQTAHISGIYQLNVGTQYDI